MDNKLCNRCGTENLPDYRFCKNCGNPLDLSGQAGGYAQPMYAPQPIYTDTIDGVATADVAAFVGKSAPKYIPKFCQMELNRSTVSFNWLFAVITIVVTPFFAPCWFIHKKMYKIGFLLFGILAVLELVSVGVTLSVMDTMYSEMIRSGIFGGTMTSSQINQYIFEFFENSPLYSLISIISSFVRIVTFAIGILGGLFANYLYKKHAVNTIKSIVAVDQNNYKEQVVSRGGTKHWVWITVSAVFFVIIFAIIFIGSFIVAFNALSNINYMV